MASLADTPDILPVAERAVCIRDDERGRAPAFVKPNPRPDWFLAIDCETATPATATMPGFNAPEWRQGQPLLFGCAAIGATPSMIVEKEFVFFADDLPLHGRAVLRRWFESRTMDIGAGERVWRDRQSVRAELMSASDFLEKILYRYGYKRRALIIGLNLPFDLSRFAAYWGEPRPSWRQGQKGKRVAARRENLFEGGFSLSLWGSLDPETGELRESLFRPRLRIKHAQSDVTFFGFAGCRGEGEKTSRYEGQFLDLSQLMFALTGQHWSLAGACKLFCDLTLNKTVEHGRITGRYAEYCLGDVRGTVALAKALLAIFDRNARSRAAGSNLPECRAFTPAGIVRADLKACGLKAPEVSRDWLGPAMSACMGGLAETNYTGKAPVIMVDFSKCYQRVFELLRLWDLATAEKLLLVEATAEIRDLVKRFERKDALTQDRWPDWRAIVLCRPAGEVVPARIGFARAEDGKPIFNLANCPITFDEPIYRYLPDLLASKLLTPGGSGQQTAGRRFPEIVKAWRIVPDGKQHMRGIRLWGGVPFGPRRESLIKRAVLEAERLNPERNPGDPLWADLSPEARKALYRGRKDGGNSLASGSWVQTVTMENPAKAILLHGAGEQIETLPHPEERGEFFCPPIFGLVTAGARLLLATAHSLVAERRGVVAMTDTDSAAIIARENSALDYENTNDRRLLMLGFNDDRPRILSRREVEGICEAFEPLDTFEGRAGRVLQIKFGAGEDIEGEFINPKRYALRRPDGSFADRKESIVGAFMPPTAPGFAASKAAFIDEFWNAVFALRELKPLAPYPWLPLPAIAQQTVSTPGMLESLKRLPGMRPFDFILAGTAKTRRTVEGRSKIESRRVIAPFEPDPSVWASLCWVFATTGKPFVAGEPDKEGLVWHLEALEEVARDYGLKFPRDKLAGPLSPMGKPRGILLRRTVKAGARWLTLKESAWAGDPRDATNAIGSAPTPAFARRIGADARWPAAAREAIRIVGAAAFAKRFGVRPDRVYGWLADTCPSDPEKTLEAIVSALEDLGLTFEQELSALSRETICTFAPVRAEILRRFLAVAIGRLAAENGGMDAFAGKLGIGKSVFYDRKAKLGRGELSPAALNEMARVLAKFALSGLSKARRSRLGLSEGPIGDRQALCWALAGKGKGDLAVPEEGEVFERMEELAVESDAGRAATLAEVD